MADQQSTPPEPNYTDGRRDAMREIARNLKNLSRQEIRLAAGEMTSQEMRTVLAVLKWQSLRIEQIADAIKG